jgi:hypothetical protein
MSWVLFEVVLALGLAVFIVWWTFPKEKNRPPPDGQASGKEGDDTQG